MKVLVATALTQGARRSDYTWTVDGELVGFGVTCDRDRREGPDGGCGCGRGFAGMNSHRATTTAIVKDLPLTRQDVRTAWRGYLISAGWGLPSEQDVADDVEELLSLAAGWPVGTVIEKRGERIQARTLS